MQYPPPPQPAYGMAPVAQVPPEVGTIKSMLHIVRILCLIFGILILLAGLAYFALIYFAWAACSSVAGYCAYSGALVDFLLGPIYILITGVILFIIWTQMKSIEAKVDAQDYEGAKAQTLIWMILGFIFGIIIGVILLIAYIKYDPVITWKRSGGGGMSPPGFAPQPPPAYGQPPAGLGGQMAAPSPYGQPPASPAPAPLPPMYGQAPPAAAPAMAYSPPPPPAPSMAATPAPLCKGCGKPTSYVPQYSRYYCYGCAQYA